MKRLLEWHEYDIGWAEKTDMGKDVREYRTDEDVSVLEAQSQEGQS